MEVVRDGAVHIIVESGQLLKALELLGFEQGYEPLPDYFQSLEKLPNGNFKIVATHLDPGDD